MSSQSHEKNVLARKATKRKRELDAENSIKIAQWRDEALHSNFVNLIMAKAIYGREAWEDEETGEIKMGEYLDQESRQFYEKMVWQKLLPTPKEITETKSDSMADGLKQVLDAIEKEKIKEDKPPLIDVDLNIGGDVDL